MTGIVCPSLSLISGTANGVVGVLTILLSVYKRGGGRVQTHAWLSGLSSDLGTVPVWLFVGPEFSVISKSTWAVFSTIIIVIISLGSGQSYTASSSRYRMKDMILKRYLEG